MGIIGYNAIGGSNSNSTNATSHQLPDHSTYTYTAPVGQEVFKVWFYCGATYNGDGSGVEVGVYDITGGTNAGTLVASGTIATLTKSSWNSVTITPVALTSGNIYAVALRIISATNIKKHHTYLTNAVSESSITGTTVLAESWTDNANAGNVVSCYAETQAAVTSPTVDDVNTTETTTDGEQAATATTSNFPSEITIVKLKSGTGILNTTGVVSVGGAVTFDIPDISAITVDTAGVLFGAVDYELSDGTDTATLAGTHNEKTGWTAFTVQNVVNDEGSFSENFVGSVQDGSQVYITTADSTSISTGADTIAITAATSANPVVISVVNTFSNDDVVAIKEIVGEVELNERLFKLANVTGTTVELQSLANVNVDGSAYPAYISGGTIGLAGGVYKSSSTVNLTPKFGDASDDIWKPFNIIMAPADVTLPVITITGSTTINIEQGVPYVDQGATAVDDVDGDITASIVTTGATINTSVVGVYSVIYNVADAAGNNAVTKTRTVNVVADITLPIITLTGANPQSIDINVAYSELGATASDNVDGDITGSIIINATAVDVSTLGSYSVTYNVTDAAGNSAIQVIRTVNIVNPLAATQYRDLLKEEIGKGWHQGHLDARINNLIRGINFTLGETGLPMVNLNQDFVSSRVFDTLNRLALILGVPGVSIPASANPHMINVGRIVNTLIDKAGDDLFS